MDRENTILIYQHRTHTAHRLQNHCGKCRHLHGHTYTITIELVAGKQNTSPNKGMVMDFSEVKSIIGDWLDNAFDHALVLEKGDPLIKAIQKTDKTMFIQVMDEPPTAENMAYDILHRANTLFQNMNSHTKCIAVTVEESPGKKAMYRLPKGELA